MTDETAEKLLEKAATHLGEHFDAVVILATRQDGKLTRTTSHGVGNYHARVGMARDYAIRADADEAGAVYAQHLNRPEE